MIQCLQTCSSSSNSKTKVPKALKGFIMRIVIALGGNALLRRGEAMSADNQRENVIIAVKQIARVAPNNELVMAHKWGYSPYKMLLIAKSAPIRWMY
jgi:hypothetical protein